MNEYPELTREAWDAALEQHKNRYRIPASISDEEAVDHFAKIGPVALKSLISSYINKSRAKLKMGPIRGYRIPDSLADWIESQVKNIDEVSGHLGSSSYQTIANALLPKLRAIEHTFLGHHD